MKRIKYLGIYLPKETKDLYIENYKTKAVKRDKEGHYIMIKGSIQEDITIINIYAPNIGAPQYVRKMLTSMKGKINNNTIIVETLIPTHTYGQIN